MQKHKNSIMALDNNDLNIFNKGFCDTCYINLRIVTKWFLNHYLKSKNFKIESDLNPRHTKESFRIVDLYELMDIGWTLESYMKECMSLWDEYTDVSHELSGEAEYWVDLLNETTDNPRILLDNNNEFVGFWDYVPVVDSLLHRIKSGQFIETELSLDKIPVIVPGMSGVYNIYFIGICIKKKYRRRLALQKILFSILQVLEDFALNGIFIKEICSWATSNAGISLCESMGLNYLLDHKDIGKIYSGKIPDILDKPLSDDFKTLKALYREKFK